MSEQINSYCTICGNGYHMCLSCKDKMRMSPWKMYTDSAEHYKIHQIIYGLSTKVYTEEEALLKLKNVDLSDLETFKPNIKAIIKGILEKEKIKEETIEMVETEEKAVVKKPAYSRKRNYAVNKVEVNEVANEVVEIE